MRKLMGRVRPLCDLAPDTVLRAGEILAGLRGNPKQLSPKFLYDLQGSRLFDEICRLPEYYPTRTEAGILREHVDELAEYAGDGAVLIEYGSGSSRKTGILLDRLSGVSVYVPIDIASEHLLESAERLSRKYPDLEIRPICADYLALEKMPAEEELPAGRRLVFFPGSTIGNLRPQEAAQLLRRMGSLCGPRGGLVIGVDLRKEKEILERAYNDSRGITAAFNLNLLRRLNAELKADFDTATFRHRAFFNGENSRIEMHLLSLIEQEVHVAGETIHFEEGETIHTESSYKYGLEEFDALLRHSGLEPLRTWTDSRCLFSVHLCAVARPPAS